jgi:hypothetical protein
MTLLLILLMASALTAQDSAAPRIESITQGDLRADLFFLAGDGMRGRLTNTPENALAADWIKARFERLGLKPAGPGGSYVQSYNLMTATIGAENQIEINGASRRRAGQDFYPLRFSSTGSVTADVVFAGFGITSPERKYDDFAGGAIKGKIALVIDHEPGERDPNSPFDGVVTAQAANPLLKALAAQEHGAVGILFVDDVHNHPGEANFEANARNYWPERTPRIDNFTLAAWMEKVRIPAAQISPALAGQILAESGRTLEQLSTASETERGITPVAINSARVEMTTSVDRHVVPDRNVLAAIEGADAKLKDEWVVVCAHIDHNGADGNEIFNGADDDGSGIVGLLEIAEAWTLAAAGGQRPRRSVLFAAWNSEERGLLGAWAYTERPTVAPLDRITAVLNMDMIGRNEEVPVGGGARFRGLDLQTAESNRNATNVIGTTRSASLKAAIERANRSIGLELKFRYDNNASNLMRRSDHWPFLQRGVPGVWFHTGLHPDYHTVYDRPEKINYEKMEKVARLVYQTSWNLAVTERTPGMTNATMK